MTQSEKDKQILDLVRKLSAAKCNLRHHQIKLDEDVTVLFGAAEFVKLTRGAGGLTADNLSRCPDVQSKTVLVEDLVAVETLTAEVASIEKALADLQIVL